MPPCPHRGDARHVAHARLAGQPDIGSSCVRLPNKEANLRVELLTFEGCPNQDRARELVEKVLADKGIDPKSLTMVLLEGQDADAWRFPGSPTIRINGRDVEPGFREPAEYSLSCRVYQTESGLQGLPDPRWVELAIDEALVRMNVRHAQS